MCYILVNQYWFASYSTLVQFTLANYQHIVMVYLSRQLPWLSPRDKAKEALAGSMADSISLFRHLDLLLLLLSVNIRFLASHAVPLICSTPLHCIARLLFSDGACVRHAIPTADRSLRITLNCYLYFEYYHHLLILLSLDIICLSVYVSIFELFYYQHLSLLFHFIFTFTCLYTI